MKHTVFDETLYGIFSEYQKSLPDLNFPRPFDAKIDFGPESNKSHFCQMKKSNFFWARRPLGLYQNHEKPIKSIDSHPGPGKFKGLEGLSKILDSKSSPGTCQTTLKKPGWPRLRLTYTQCSRTHVRSTF